MAGSRRFGVLSCAGKWRTGLFSGVLLLGVLQTPDLVAAAPAAARPASAGATSEPTAAAAQKAARRTGKPVEIAAFRGETREVYAESNGSFTSVEHLRPVRTRQGDKWVNIDTRLHVLADGSIAPVASSVGLRFSGGGAGPMARLDRAGRDLSLTWPGTLPKPTIDGDTATYADVLPGVDLKLRAEPDGMNQLIVVRTPPGGTRPAAGPVAARHEHAAVEGRAVDRRRSAGGRHRDRPRGVRRADAADVGLDTTGEGIRRR